MIDRKIFPTISKKLFSKKGKKIDVKLFPRSVELLNENQYISV
jgi:hypothetical protein